MPALVLSLRGGRGRGRARGPAEAALKHIVLAVLVAAPVAAATALEPASDAACASPAHAALLDPCARWAASREGAVRAAAASASAFVAAGDRAEGDGALAGYDPATGALLWSWPPTEDPFHVTALLLDEGDVVYATGWSWAQPRGTNVVTLALNAATGDIFWRASWDSLDPSCDNCPSDDVPKALAMHASGGYLAVAAQSPGPNTAVDLTTLLYDLATGEPRVLRSNGQGPWSDVPDLAEDVAFAGDVVVVTGGTGGVPAGALTIAYDRTSGAELWRDVSPGTMLGRMRVLASTDGTRVFATASTGDALAVRAFDARTGARGFETSLAAGAGLAAFPADLRRSADGELVYVAGHVGGAVVLALDASDGAVAWRVDLPGLAIDHAAALALSPDERVLHVARTQHELVTPTQVTSDAVVASFLAATGTPLGKTAHARAGPDTAHALAASARGLVLGGAGGEGAAGFVVGFDASPVARAPPGPAGCTSVRPAHLVNLIACGDASSSGPAALLCVESVGWVNGVDHGVVVSAEASRDGPAASADAGALAATPQGVCDARTAGRQALL